MSKYITLFGILLIILASSCQKEISYEVGTRDTTSSSTAIFKMKIGGTQWVATKDVSVSILGGFISINGVSSDNKALSITLNDSVPGTYVLDQTSFHLAALSDSSDVGGLPYVSNEGKDSTQAGGVVVVTSVDKVNKTISGTFHFKLYRDFDSKQKVITEGVFTKLPYLVTLPPANAADTFHVKIDNVDWTGKSISAISTGTDLFINGSEPDLSRLVSVAFPATITPGTYSFDTVTGTYVGIYAPTSATFLTSLTGKLTILEHNKTTKRIRGNFDFKAFDVASTKTAQLSSGYFSVIYQ